MSETFSKAAYDQSCRDVNEWGFYKYVIIIIAIDHSFRQCFICPVHTKWISALKSWYLNYSLEEHREKSRFCQYFYVVLKLLLMFIVAEVSLLRGKGAVRAWGNEGVPCLGSVENCNWNSKPAIGSQKWRCPGKSVCTCTKGLRWRHIASGEAELQKTIKKKLEYDLLEEENMSLFMIYVILFMMLICHYFILLLFMRERLLMFNVFIIFSVS